MPFPTTAFGVAAIIVLLVPGLAYSLVRRALKGFQYDDLTIDARVAQALVVSILLDAVYLLFASPWMGELIEVKADQVFIKSPFWVGIAVVFGAFIVPWLLAFLFNCPYRVRRQDQKKPPANESRLHKIGRALGGKFPFRVERTSYYASVPTAWDWVATQPQGRMIRVTLPDGRRVGGFYGPGSYASTYPEPRDIFISHQYQMDSDGSLSEPAEGAAGMWLRISDEHIVEFHELSYTEEQLTEIEAGKNG